MCDNVYLNPLGAIAYLSFMLGDDQAGRPQDQALLASCKAHGTDQCHCLYRPLRHMVVAPSFVREVRDPILLEIWRNALEVLRQADEWIIVGYSLPPEDVAIRSMFLRASRGREMFCLYPPPQPCCLLDPPLHPDQHIYTPRQQLISAGRPCS